MTPGPGCPLLRPAQPPDTTSLHHWLSDHPQRHLFLGLLGIIPPLDSESLGSLDAGLHCAGSSQHWHLTGLQGKSGWLIGGQGLSCPNLGSLRTEPPAAAEAEWEGETLVTAGQGAPQQQRNKTQENKSLPILPGTTQTACTSTNPTPRGHAGKGGIPPRTRWEKQGLSFLH